MRSFLCVCAILGDATPAMTCMDALMQRLHGCNEAAHAPAAYRPSRHRHSCHDVHGRTNAAVAWMQ